MQLSVIIPARTAEEADPLLQQLRKLFAEDATTEIFLALGNQPAAQRNQALGQACGEWVLFLDADCQVDRAYCERVRSWTQQAEADVVGGPVLLPEGSTTCQQIWQQALGSPLAGQVASRYRSAGKIRPCSDAELILCNLLVRRSCFEKFGRFSPELYPNEENEWLERLRGLAVLLHDPSLVVRRPQRQNLAAFSFMLLRYGAGRTAQFRISRKWDWRNLGALLPLAGLYLLFRKPRWALCGACGAFLLSAVLTRAKAQDETADLPPPLAAAVGAASLWMIAAYALGQLLGWFGWPAKPDPVPIEIRRIQ